MEIKNFVYAEYMPQGSDSVVLESEFRRKIMRTELSYIQLSQRHSITDSTNKTGLPYNFGADAGYQDNIFKKVCRVVKNFFYHVAFYATLGFVNLDTQILVNLACDFKKVRSDGVTVLTYRKIPALVSSREWNGEVERHRVRIIMDDQQNAFLRINRAG